ncbi:CatA-like O-acetyltransferase [Pseudoalteromonas phenolica]|uniref:Chloramphenicol acetyltransferase n=1 Tax=Pseudoalteromonas phenolica TaxID=161398 RepID=A0A0S2K3A3_9GAMM|nr:CatA-like O-acetyltransferase [Pseudoalteromonas phenolica]ALO42543.1 Chloramphenicol acetyltransferase [Pseudoalteromonas phenolica]MBE0356352.1 chloramphenicol O-acetyltransferase [Pseudoalteromonas phenolica O-BC30]RXF05973.1 chloramphenicol acetyltransferase [Pseudoalteromonas phenolica O-BC30]
MKKIDLDTWPRAEHFKFFLPFSQPYFNVVIDLDAKLLFKYAKSQQLSFTACYLYCLQEAVERYAPMRYRIVDDEPVEVSGVSLSTVFLRADESFRFVPLEIQNSLLEYCDHYTHQKQNFLGKPLLNSYFVENADKITQMYISILPWFKFSGFKHAEHTPIASGIPKVVFGQYQKEQGTLPISIEVHHALMDGLHISQFIDVFNQVVAEICKEK